MGWGPRGGWGQRKLEHRGRSSVKQAPRTQTHGPNPSQPQRGRPGSMTRGESEAQRVTRHLRGKLRLEPPPLRPPAPGLLPPLRARHLLPLSFPPAACSTFCMRDASLSELVCEPPGTVPGALCASNKY